MKPFNCCLNFCYVSCQCVKNDILYTGYYRNMLFEGIRDEFIVILSKCMMYYTQVTPVTCLMKKQEMIYCDIGNILQRNQGVFLVD